MEDILYKRLSDETIGACIEVHKLMGPNLSEKIYEACVKNELIKRGYHAERQKWIDIFFKGEKLEELGVLLLGVDLDQVATGGQKAGINLQSNSGSASRERAYRSIDPASVCGDDTHRPIAAAAGLVGEIEDQSQRALVR